MSDNVLQDPIPVRFTSRTKRRLNALAKRFGLNASQIVRQAVESRLPDWEAGNLVITPKSERELAAR